MEAPLFKVTPQKSTPELDALHASIVEGTMRLASSYTRMTEALVRAALDLGHRFEEMSLEEHDDMIPRYSRRTVLYVTRDETREKFGEVVCLCEDLRFRLRMTI